MIGRALDILNDDSADSADVAAVTVRVELCAYCGKERVEPESDPADMLERGDDALAEIDGRDDRRSDVNVAAAFISMSTSAAPSSEPRTFCLALPFSWLRSCSLPLVPFRPFDRVWDPSVARFDLVVLRGVDALPALVGAGIGGSSGLWIVRARFAGGGAKIDENKLCVADAVTGGGGAIDPLRAPDLDEPVGVIALFPCVAGLL